MMKKNVEVVYIITKLELGGAQKVCLSLFNGLSNQGYNCHLISGNEGPLVPEIERAKNTILLESFKREISLKAFIQEFRTFFTLIKKLRELKKANSHLIVHTHSTKAGILGRWAAFFARIKTRIHTVHGFAFHDHQSKIAWWLIYGAEFLTSLITTHFICVSARDAKTGMKFLPWFKNKHSIIRAGVQWEQFYTPAISYPTVTSPKTFIFGSISCFKPQKNLIDLLQAFALVYAQDARARLEIIGDGAQRPMLEQWILDRQLTRVITLHGWQQQVNPIMKQWHAFTLSSLWEGLPCAIIEARLMHLPVISYDIGGIKEVIYDQQNGLLAPAGDWQALANNMLRLMHDHDLYAGMQKFPDKLRDFNTKHMVTEHITLYKNF